MIHGRFSRILVKNSNNSGNYIQVRYSNDSLTKTYENIELKYLTGSLASLGTLRGVEKVEGGISGILADGKTEGLFLKSLFITEEVEQVGTKWKHIFKLNNNISTEPPTLDIVKDIQLEKRKINNYRVSKFSFKIEPNAILTYDVEGKAKGQDIITQNLVSTKNDFVVIPSWQIVLKIDGVEYKPKSIEFSYEESTDYDYRVGVRQPVSITRGVVNASVKVDFLLNNESILFKNKYDNDSIVSIYIEAQTQNNDKWIITIPKCEIGNYSENSGDEILTNSIEFTMIANENAIEDTINFILVNDLEDLY